MRVIVDAIFPVLLFIVGSNGLKSRSSVLRPRVKNPTVIFLSNFVVCCLLSNKHRLPDFNKLCSCFLLFSAFSPEPVF